MKRIIDNELRAWQLAPDRKALLVRGARQVGKTYSIRQLGETYDELVELNLEMKPEYAQLFRQDLDPYRIVRDLRLMTGKRLIPGKSLLFIDEIQQEPLAVNALRYFYEIMPQMHLVAAGSLLEFAIEEIGIPVGRITSLHMYPISFLEFLVARKHDALAGHLLDGEPPFPVSPPVHEKYLRLVGEYLAVGGMPEAVQSWVEHEDLARCSRIHTAITTAYRQDFAKYAKKHQVKYVDQVFNEASRLIGRKFKFSALSGQWKARELAPALDLLCKASVIHKITRSSGNGIPLKAESDPKHFKILFLDIGLAQSVLGLKVADWILDPAATVVNAGSITEAFIGQELLAYSRPWSAHELHYWHREARASNAEVDYLLEAEEAIVPVEVKSGTTGSLRSLRLFLEEKRGKTPFGIRFSGQAGSIHHDLHSFAVYAVANLFREQIARDWF